MKDFYKLYSIGKNTKKPYSRGKSFGYQVLGFGSGFSSAIAHRGVWAGGLTPSNSNVIDFVEIATLGNASDFGNMTASKARSSGTASTTRGLFFGGHTPGRLATIDFIEVATEGNAADFGDMSAVGQFGAAGNNGTRAVNALGDTNDSATNVIEFVTIASAGNSTDFGDVTAARTGLGECASSVRICYMGGNGGAGTIGNYDIIDFVTTASAGNATDFGNLTGVNSAGSGCGSGTRGVHMGGNDNSENTIEFITIASAGNATDFGDLTSVSNNGGAACSSPTRGLKAIGSNPSLTAQIDYITIASAGNSADFGDLSVARNFNGALSNGNGGLSA
jgi:hypothetical protein